MHTIKHQLEYDNTFLEIKQFLASFWDAGGAGKQGFIWRMCEDTSQISGNVKVDIMATDIGDHTSTI